VYVCVYVVVCLILVLSLCVCTDGWQLPTLPQLCLGGLRLSLNAFNGSFACAGTLIHIIETMPTTWCVASRHR
jgi:hypothetical protein